MPSLASLCRAVIGLTGSHRSFLAQRADVALVYGPLDEACPLGLAPSASTAANWRPGWAWSRGDTRRAARHDALG